jgi:hypothetical protein
VLAPPPQGTGNDRKIFQALPTQTDTTIAFIYKILIKNLGVRINRVFKFKRRKKDFQLRNHMKANPPLTKLTSVDSL